MNRVAIAFMTKDRAELTAKTIEPLISDKYALFWFDGSKTKAGEDIRHKYPVTAMHANIGGGPDTAVMYAITFLLQHPANYTHIGIIENDVLLHPDWFGPTMALFARGAYDGLVVGAASPRAYVDRILCQRDGYALMHNLGFGVNILSREAAWIMMQNHRSSATLENRKLFAKLSGLDIGRWWAFGGNQHWITGDWGVERVLAAHGLAALALTPSPVEMIGQFPPLHEQGLVLSQDPIELLRNNSAFEMFCERTSRIRAQDWAPADHRWARQHEEIIYFPHQLKHVGAKYSGDWRLKWSQGFGPWTWVAGAADATLELSIAGPARFALGGGPEGSEVEITCGDWRFQPTLPPHNQIEKSEPIMLCNVPGECDYRRVVVRALKPGVSFYALHTADPQPFDLNSTFDHSDLPPI